MGGRKAIAGGELCVIRQDKRSRLKLIKLYRIKMKKLLYVFGGIIILIVIVAIVAGGGGGEKKEETSKQQPSQEIQAMEVSTQNFIAEFDKNQLAAEEKYKDKLIEFTAIIENISEDILGTPYLSLKPTTEEFYFGTTIKCEFGDKSQLVTLENGQSVNLQGTVETQSLGIISIKNCKVIQ